MTCHVSLPSSPPHLHTSTPLSPSLQPQEDSLTIRAILVRLLKVDQHTCYEASDGLEAFAMVKRSLIARSASGRHGPQAAASALSVVYDLIIMDSNMPEMSGIEATVEMRKAGFKGPIIGMPSGNIDEADFLRAGANEVLEKPVSGAELKKTIAKAMLDFRTAQRRVSVTNNGSVKGHGTRPSVTASVPRQGRAPSVRMSAMRVAPASSVRAGSRASPPPLTGARLAASVTGAKPRSAFASKSASVAPANVDSNQLPDDDFTTDIVDVMGWEKLISYSLNFTDPQLTSAEMRWAFMEYRRSGLNHRLLFVMSVLSVVYVATRGSVATLWTLSPVFAAAFANFVVTVMCISATCAGRLAVISFRYKIKLLQPYHQAAVTLAISRYADVFENIGVVAITLCVGLYMLARVLQGPCPAGTTPWNEQECNPEGSMGEVPQEALVTLIVAIISFQLFVNGACKEAVTVAWAVALVLANISMQLVGSRLFLWNNVVLVGGAIVSYEFER